MATDSSYTRFEILISIIFLFVSAFICIITTLPLIRQICKHRHINSKNTVTSIFIIGCVSSSTLCVLADFVRHIICYYLNVDLYVYPLNNIMGSADLFYYLGAILFYLIAIHRVQISFHDTNLAINCYVLCFFYILISSIFLLTIYYVLIVFINPDDPKYWTPSTHNFWYKYDRIPMITIGIMDFILNLSLLTLFISKLNELISARLLNCDLNKLRNKHGQIFIFSHNLLTLMTRHTVLFTFAVFTNQIWYITVLIQNNFKIGLYLTTFCFRAIGNTSNCIILFLSFQDNLLFYLTICGCCHRNIQRCFISNILSRLHGNNMDNNSSILPYNYKLMDDTSVQESTTTIQNSSITDWKP